MDGSPTASGHFCRTCGSLFVAGSSCPLCGESLLEFQSEYNFSFSISLSVLVCESCGHFMSIGTISCPMCNQAIGSNEISDPREGRTNKLKLASLGDLLPRFSELANAPSELSHSTTTVTDEQFIVYIRRNDLISASLLERLKANALRVVINDETMIQSRQTRLALEELLREQESIRRQFDDLLKIGVSEQLHDFYLFLLAVYRDLLEFNYLVVTALLSLTIEDAHNAQHLIQRTLDGIAATAQSMLIELNQLSLDATGIEQISDRLSVYVGIDRRYEHSNRIDLATAISTALGEDGDFSRLTDRGANFFRGVVQLNPAALGFVDSLVLFTLAAEVSALEDPLSVRGRASVLLGLLNDALILDSQVMIELFSSWEADAEIVAINYLSLGDRLRSLKPEELPKEAFRQELATMYATITEWIYQKSLTLILVGKSIVQGNPKPYHEIADADFGAKVNELRQASDLRYVSALLGVSTVARNAGAHGDVDTSGDKIILRKRDKKGRVEVEELTDDEFVERLKNLLHTCRSILLAGELFRFQHSAVLPAPKLPQARRIASEVARILVGMFGLVRAEIIFDQGDNVLLKADEDEHRAGRDARGYFACAFTLALLFRDSSTLEVRISRFGNQKHRITTPINEVLAYEHFPIHAQTIALLKLCFLTRIEGDLETEQARLVREIVRPASRMLLQDIETLGNNANSQLSRSDLMAAANVLDEKLDALALLLSSLVLERSSIGPRDSILVALGAAKRWVAHCLSLDKSNWCKPDRNYQRAMTILKKWN